MVQDKPTGKSKYKRIEGDTRTLVIILTMDFNGKGLTILFNESKGKYWNYARAVNQAYKWNWIFG